MPINRQAKYLSVNDFGKPITIQGKETAITGVLVGIDALADFAIERRSASETSTILGHSDISLVILLETGCINVPVKPNTQITIDGTPTPPGLNLHQPVTQQDHGGQGG
ncbi:hypothetical protein [Glutamicibacter sp. 2E12]|uniref:hypothetical protein n=1 Tax=Glutamicibacter sp. 2E12 TaxID=3416181 RepID=UPI003CEBF05D